MHMQEQGKEGPIKKQSRKSYPYYILKQKFCLFSQRKLILLLIWLRSVNEKTEMNRNGSV